MLKAAIESTGETVFNYLIKLAKIGSKYLLIVYYITSVAFISYFLSGTSIFATFIIAYAVAIAVPFLIVLFFSSYQKYKRRRLVRPESGSIKYWENNPRSLLLLAVCSWSLGFNVMTPFIFFGIYLEYTKRIIKMNSIAFFYAAVGQNISSISLIQFSFGIWVSLILDIWHNKPDPHIKLQEKVTNMIIYGGWYATLFCLISIFIGSIGGLFNEETSSVIAFVFFLLFGFLFLIVYMVRNHRF